jgi:hypothetical protein
MRLIRIHRYTYPTTPLERGHVFQVDIPVITSFEPWRLPIGARHDELSWKAFVNINCPLCEWKKLAWAWRHSHDWDCSRLLNSARCAIQAHLVMKHRTTARTISFQWLNRHRTASL